MCTAYRLSVLSSLLLFLQLTRTALAATETKPTFVPAPSRPGREPSDLSTAGSVAYPYSLGAYGAVNPLAALALLASQPPPPPLHPLLLASLMGGAPILPPAAGTGTAAASAAAAAAASAPVSFVGAGQGHNPLLAYLLTQYARHLPYGAVNYSLPGYSASNNVHNSKAFGAYKYEDRH